MKFYAIFLLTLSIVACQHENANESSEIDRTPGNEPLAEEIFVEYDMKLEEVENESLPVDCDYSGYMIDGWKWDDANGTNYLLRTEEEPHDDMTDNPEEYVSLDQYLHVYHYVENNDGQVSLLRELTDFEKDCDFDLGVSHLEQLNISDLDSDNIAEVVFGYRLACRSDVSPSSQKVVMFENGDKYILRGTTEVMGYGGDCKVGEEFNTAPAGFLQAAKDYWEANKTEFEMSE